MKQEKWATEHSEAGRQEEGEVSSQGSKPRPQPREACLPEGLVRSPSSPCDFSPRTGKMGPGGRGVGGWMEIPKILLDFHFVTNVSYVLLFFPFYFALWASFRIFYSDFSLQSLILFFVSLLLKPRDQFPVLYFRYVYVFSVLESHLNLFYIDSNS